MEAQIVKAAPLKPNTAPTQKAESVISRTNSPEHITYTTIMMSLKNELIQSRLNPGFSSKIIGVKRLGSAF